MPQNFQSPCRPVRTLLFRPLPFASATLDQSDHLADLGSMNQETTISWTRFTVNPWEGCTRVSSGCDNCYAATASNVHHGSLKYWQPMGPRLVIKGWRDKLAVAKRAAIREGRIMPVFTASISDIFERDRIMENRDGTASELTTTKVRQEFFKAIDETPECLFLLLTKRPGNIPSMVPAHWLDKCPQNVMFGASIVNQEEAERDIPKLLEAPGIMNKFISMEPMLGPIDLFSVVVKCKRCNGSGTREITEGGGIPCKECLNSPNGQGWVFIDSQMQPFEWIIVGGESGSKAKARPIHPDWIKAIKDYCDTTFTAFHFKQWGNHVPMTYTANDGNEVTTMTYNRNQHHRDFPFGSGILHDGFPDNFNRKIKNV